ncbi:MAG: hypothetical protein IJF44_04075 [Clostridia bacterium]|nr:hypothetical protein [Clostridia bacterium]
MKKKWLTLGCMALGAMFAFSGCGDASVDSSDPNKPVDPTGYIKQTAKSEYIVNENYAPKNVKQQQGQIDVAIVFEGTEEGWQAVADEYSRLHSGAAVVNLVKGKTSATYSDEVKNALDGSGTDWDIIQGNLAGGKASTYCLDISGEVYKANAYAGGKMWYSVLKEDAYISDKSGVSNESYLINSEGLQTAWFVNTVALEKAGVEGYKNKKGDVANPVTWDDLMSLCYYMEEAGYTNPLGIALDTDSISASQFTWLLRVYGDYYYRNEYVTIAEDQDKYKDMDDAKKFAYLSEEQPEAAKDYKYSLTRLFNVILDNGANDLYVGGESAKFQDFVSQLGKMKNYLSLDAASTSMAEMRTKFGSQSGSNPPQIMLDYAGAGLGYMAKETASFKIDYFDYPYMESTFVDEANTLLRDVGGNGGYLSIVAHPGNQAQINLTLDFMKFFMSPYGQSVYYTGLEKAGSTPMGLTTVLADYVKIPAAWQEFFTSTDKITFTGLSDSNPFISFFIRSLSEGTYSSAEAVRLWQGYLSTGSVESAREFGNSWHDVLKDDWKNFCKKTGYNEKCYLYPGQDPTYGGK